MIFRKNVIRNTTTMLPLFSAQKRDIDVLLTQFQSEQDAILNILIQVQRGDEYHTTHSSIGITMSEQYYNIMAVAEEFGLSDLTGVP